jgi:hypothetical protein
MKRHEMTRAVPSSPVTVERTKTTNPQAPWQRHHFLPGTVAWCRRDLPWTFGTDLGLSSVEIMGSMVDSEFPYVDPF